MSAVSEYSAQLANRLDEAAEEGLAIPEIRAWMTEEGVQPNEINLVIGGGQRRYNTKWHRKDDRLFTGVHPDKVGQNQGKGDQTPNEIPSLSEGAGAMSSPEEHFKTIAESLGVQTKAAQIAANYCFTNYSMEDPTEAWTALQECNDITIMSRKKLWKTWMSFNQVDPPEELERQVKRWDVKPDKGGAEQSTGTAAITVAAAGKKFLAIDGEVVITEEDDPLGVSMSEALHMARLQLERIKSREPVPTQGANNGETNVMVEALKQIGETARSNGQGDGNAAALLESNRREMETKLDSTANVFRMMQETSDTRHAAMLEQMQKSSEHQMDMMVQQNAHNMEMLKMALDSANQDPPPSLLDQVGEFMANESIKKFMTPAAPAGPGITIRMGDNDVPLAAYEKIMEINTKQEMVKTAREFLPDFISAINEVATSRKAELTEGGAGASETVPTYHAQCVKCQEWVKYFNADGFRCPQCFTLQQSDGQVIDETPGPIQHVWEEHGAQGESSEFSLGEEAPVPERREFLDPLHVGEFPLDLEVKEAAYVESDPEYSDVMYPEPVPMRNYDEEWYLEYPMVAGLGYLDPAANASDSPEIAETREEPEAPVEREITPEAVAV